MPIIKVFSNYWLYITSLYGFKQILSTDRFKNAEDGV